MKILHVVTMMSSDGAFGGPLTVAMTQAAELRRRGHDVTIAAGWSGTEIPPQSLAGTPARLFRLYRALPLGFSGLLSPRLLYWLWINAASFDLVHIHAGRDLVTLPAMAVCRHLAVPYVVQTHGMIGVDGRRAARLLDAFATRGLLAAASRHLVLTDEEERHLPQVEPSVRLHRVLNGLSMRGSTQGRNAPSNSEVLFCARLHVRKRPVDFVKMAALVHAELPMSTFAIVGPDQGELPAVLSAIQDLRLQNVVRYEGSCSGEAVTSRMKRAAVYVLPSVDEPFPMSLLEALSVGLPSVCTTSCGIAGVLKSRGAALVTDGSAQKLADAVRTLLTNQEVYAKMSQSATQSVTEYFSIEAVVADLEIVYLSAVNA